MSKIKITKDGPYYITGDISLKELTISQDINGCSYINEKVINHPKNYYLCRCGKSKHKPFCDGSHKNNNFDGTTVSKEHVLKEYCGKNYTLKDNEELCAFARFCHINGTDTWELIENSDDKNNEELAIKTTSDCPSGRLVICDNKTGKPIEPDYEEEIVLLEDPSRGCKGPIWVKGGIEIEDENGNILEKRNRVTLCRCGKSKNIPYCDSSHIYNSDL